MKLNTFQKSSLVVGLSLLLFTGCSDQATFEDSEINVTIALCDDNNISKWTTLVKDDVVLGNEGSQLQFDHDSANNKKVCVKVVNTAHIIRLGV